MKHRRCPALHPPFLRKFSQTLYPFQVNTMLHLVKMYHQEKEPVHENDIRTQRALGEDDVDQWQRK